ncbi:MAG: type IV pilus modification protein PilV [Thiothrix sp.]
MQNYLPAARRQTGLSLLEVLIATIVLSAGLLGLAGLQISGMKTTHNSYQMQQATWLVYDLLERMRANKTEVFRTSGSSSSQIPASNYLLTTTTVAATYCATPLTKDCSTASDCTNAEVATYDLHNILCGHGANTGINNTLLGGQIQITCPSANNCRRGVRIHLQWDERNPTRQTDMDGGTDGIETFNIQLTAIL